jgi:hypothetical protein
MSLYTVRELSEIWGVTMQTTKKRLLQIGIEPAGVKLVRGQKTRAYEIYAEGFPEHGKPENGEYTEFMLLIAKLQSAITILDTKIDNLQSVLLGMASTGQIPAPAIAVEPAPEPVLTVEPDPVFSVEPDPVVSVEHVPEPPASAKRKECDGVYRVLMSALSDFYMDSPENEWTYENPCGLTDWTMVQFYRRKDMDDERLSTQWMTMALARIRVLRDSGTEAAA